MTLLDIAVLVAALGSAIIGGIFFAFSTFIMRSLAALPPAHGVAVMVSINRVILRSFFMPVFVGTAGLGVVLAILAFVPWSHVSVWLLLGAFFYVVGTFLVTLRGNVPLNNELDRADPAADNSALWSRYVLNWTPWNHVRTVAALAAAICWIAAVIK